MRGFLKKMDIKNRSAKYATMTTCMDTNTNAIAKMTELLQPYGLTKAAEGLKIKVDGMKGPPWGGYQKQLEVFADKIISSK
jgi:hypothetical protein